MAQGVLPFAIPPGYGDETWVETAETALVRQGLKAALDRRSSERLWIHGASGVGKTHCAVRLVEALEGLYLHAGAIQPSDLEPLIENASQHPWVVIDGVDAWLGSARMEEAVFSIWKRYPGVLFLTARHKPQAVDWVLPDLQSRARAALVLPITRLDDSDLEMLLVRQCAARGLALSEEVKGFLLSRMPRHPATLIQWLDQLDRRSLAAQRRLTIPFLRTVFAESTWMQNTE